MRRLLMSGFVVIFTLAVASGWAQEGDSISSDTLQNLAKSAVFLRAERVFKLDGFESSGSGFFAHPDGYILTNWHVVSDQVESYIWQKEREVSAKVIRLTAVIDSGTPAERRLPAKIIARDRKRDLALVKVNYRPQHFVDLDVIDDVRLGDRIWSAGFPFGDLLAQDRKANREDMPNPEVTLVSGAVTSLRRDTEGRLAKVQTDAALNPGSSGSPIINSRGNLVGVVYAGIAGGQGISFGISPNQIRDFVKHQAIRVTVSPGIVLSPPQPIEVSVQPVLVEFKDVTGWVELEGDDIDTVEFDFQESPTGLQATVLFPDRIPGQPRPPRYYLSVQLTQKIASERFRRRFALDAVPESFETLKSDRAPSEMMEDRKVLSHEMKIEDYNKSKQVSGSGGSSLADIAKDMKLKTSTSGTVIVDNQAVNEIGATAIDPGRYKYIEDAKLKSALQRYDAYTYEIDSLNHQISAGATGTQYRTLRSRISELEEKRRKIRPYFREQRVCQCRGSDTYFVAGGNPDKYPCGNYSQAF